MLKQGEEWAFVPGIGIQVKNGKNVRNPTDEEMEHIVNIMNEQGSNIITLFCRTEDCPGKGGWIRRSVEDAKQNALGLVCEDCKKPMVR